MKKITIIIIFMAVLPLIAIGQTDSSKIEELRTQSGVDPTRVTTKLVYSVWYYAKSDNRSQIINRVNFTAGVNRWSFSIKPELITNNTGIPGEGFSTQAGDIRFSVLNAFFVKGKHAFAGAAEFTLPTGSIGFGSQYFSVNPSLTYAYTISQSLFFAIQPQYLFHINKDAAYPDLSVLTVRPFIAKFFKSGLFIVFEPRLINDFKNDNFDLILSPIIGASLGGGFNFTSVLEFPTRQQTIDNRGILVQMGVTKNF